jgi:hypothetical protein
VPALTGGCQCGSVRYVLAVAPARTDLCACRMCQKAVGGPFAVLAQVPREHFAWTRGTPGAFRSFSVASRNFCRDCGSPLTYSADVDDVITVTAGTLDTPEVAWPVEIWGVESLMPWLTPDTLATLPRRHSDEDPTLPPVVSYQHPNRD